MLLPPLRADDLMPTPALEHGCCAWGRASEMMLAPCPWTWTHAPVDTCYEYTDVVQRSVERESIDHFYLLVLGLLVLGSYSGPTQTTYLVECAVGRGR